MPDYGESRLLALPTEILQDIFALLAKADIQSVRLSCSTLAHIGVGYLFTELRIVHKREHFKRLLKISKQPHISRCVRSLYYQPDIFKPQRDHEWRRRYCERVGSIRDVPERDQQKSAEAHKALCKHQRRMRRKRYDVHCLLRLFGASPRLEKVTLAFGAEDNDDSGRRKFPYTAFEAFPGISFHSSDTFLDEQRKALRVLSRATQALRQPVRKLQLSGFDLYNPHNQRLEDAELWPLTQPLHELHIEIGGTTSSSRPSIIGDVLRAASPSLPVLDLRFCRYQSPYYGDAVRWDHVLDPSADWPMLSSLAIDGTCVDQKFPGFLIDRVPALEQLSLHRLHLRSGLWQSWFTTLGGRLPKLNRVELQGFFSSEDMRDEVDFSDFLRGDVKTAVEELIVEGGICPELT